MTQVKLIFGTMTFGAQADPEESRKMLQLFLESGFSTLDTAYVYSDGASEKIIGEWTSGPEKPVVHIATKAHPRVTGKLDSQTVRKEIETSLQRLKKTQVDLFYLHQPDLNHPVEDPLEECARLYEEGKFRRLGLSNYPAWLVEKVYYVCEKHGWPLPEVYQGMYNAITRSAEPELFPALDDLGMEFYAYNPLAGGLLTGKYRSFNSTPDSGRFADMPFYLDRFWTRSAFEALEEVEGVCAGHTISMAHAALRWIVYHSQLSAEQGDGVILGARTTEQLKDNLSGAKAGPLPDPVVEALDKAWNTAKCECPSYFRFYS